MYYITEWTQITSVNSPDSREHVAVQFPWIETKRPKPVPTGQCPCAQTEPTEDMVCHNWC